ncbi:MAG: Sua5/YciO/YrdC/YwlC family protein, partial [Clostridia bacterium]|nr:Sua5/YciO/YrdC/YwlC family protein [Clostridia bacterium]
RVPSDKGAQRFLSYVDLPVAAPSANKSKHVSPVTAMHVYEDFGDEIPLILDGGRCDGGIESTVIDVTGDVPTILRKGLITADMVKKVVGKCVYAGEESDLNRRSPGTKYRHYCPKTQTGLFEANEIDAAKNFYDNVTAYGKTALIMCDHYASKAFGGRKVFDLGADGNVMANRLYFGLHEGESYDYLIGVRFVVDDEVKQSVENRFLKAFG